MKKSYFFLLIVLITFISSCNKEDENSNNPDSAPTITTADLLGKWYQINNYDSVRNFNDPLNPDTFNRFPGHWIHHYHFEDNVTLTEWGTRPEWPIDTNVLTNFDKYAYFLIGDTLSYHYNAENIPLIKLKVSRKNNQLTMISSPRKSTNGLLTTYNISVYQKRN